MAAGLVQAACLEEARPAGQGDLANAARGLQQQQARFGGLVTGVV